MIYRVPRRNVVYVRACLNGLVATTGQPVAAVDTCYKRRTGRWTAARYTIVVVVVVVVWRVTLN